MSKTKTERDLQSQLGQFFTPEPLAEELVESLPLTKESTVLEPSSGDGAFLVPLVKKFMKLHTGSRAQKLEKILNENIFAVEIDPAAHADSLARLRKEFGFLPTKHNIICSDFFLADLGDRKFDFIVGNPPFGGTIDPKLQDKLDAKYGERDGLKIKKETYSFFIVVCVEMLATNGYLRFICSDTFLTIPTMMGMREFLLNRGQTEVSKLEKCFDETDWPMAVIDFSLSGKSDYVTIDSNRLDRKTIDLTGNKSWQIANEFVKLFTGKKIGDFMVASSGMTIGCNEYFLREIVNGEIEEPYSFVFFDNPITLANEKARARLGKLSKKQIENIKGQEKNKETRRNVQIVPRDKVRNIKIPHADYLYYNKASSDIVYAQPKHVIYWRNDGEAVITFKKNGNWYLHGVGGKPFFKREGLSWQLISSTLNTRYLPPGYILDSGAPCAFLRDGIDRDELWFILGWTLTPLCTRILKEVLNHTRNIQSKDFEKLPYPFWVNSQQKKKAIQFVQELVEAAIKGKVFDRSSNEIATLAKFYKE